METKPMEIINTMPIEIVRAANGQEYFRGYAIVYYNGKPETEYKIMPNVVERIERGAVDGAINGNVELTYNHSRDYILANTDDTTLFLSPDQTGLGFSAPYDANDPDHLKVRSKIGKRIVKGCSFTADGDCQLTKEGDTYIRTITKLTHLHEVAMVNDPAYKATNAILRSIQDYDKAAFLKDWIRSLKV